MPGIDFRIQTLQALFAVCLIFNTPNLFAATRAATQNATPGQSVDFQTLVNDFQFDEAVLLVEKNSNLYLAELIHKAREKNLSQHPVWKVLVHYKNDFLGGKTSQVDGHDFYMSSQGKTQPVMELQATLASFFSYKKMPEIDITPQCRFPARYSWLKKQLSFDPKQLEEQKCEKFDTFRQVLNASGLSIIFPSAHPNSPSSMFGHTLARFDRPDQTQQNRMLAYSANYAAVDNSNNDFAYAFRGLTGGFIGKFAMVPYYIKLREYSQMENRDLWEYKIKLNQEQLDFIVEHAYELEITHFDYYFFTENCSYHLLSLIEVAVPELGLTDSFNGWVIPVDTLKILDKNNLIESKSYFPSSSTIIKHKRSKLTSQENMFAMRISKEDPDAVLPEIKHFPEKKQAAILDLAYDYQRYMKIETAGKLEAKITEDQRKLLIARSQVKVKSAPVDIPQPAITPDKGHETGKLSAGIGRFNDENYVALNVRAAYHGLLDSAEGFSPHSQIQFFDVRGRYYEDQQNLKLDRFTVIDIVSLEPRDEFFTAISWRINTGWKSLPLSDTKNKTVYTVNGGPGLTYQLNKKNNTYVYGFIEAEINHSKFYDSNFQASMGLSGGVLSNITTNWKLLLNFKYLENLNNRNFSDLTDAGELMLEQSYLLNKNLSLNLDIKREKLFDRYYSVAEGRIQFYF